MAAIPDIEPSFWTTLQTRLRGMTRVVMLTETALIIFLSSWLYEEWLSNPFMQVYTNNLLRADGGAIAIGASSVAAVGLVGAILWMRRKASSLQTVETSVSSVATAPVNPEPEPFHPAVAALRAAISGTGVMSPTVQPTGPGETSTPGGDEAGVSAGVQTAGAPLPGAAVPPVGVAIALLRTLLAKANPVQEKTEGEKAPESV